MFPEPNITDSLLTHATFTELYKEFTELYKEITSIVKSFCLLTGWEV